MSEKDKNDQAGTDDFDLRVDEVPMDSLPKVIIKGEDKPPPLPLAENKLEKVFFAGGVSNEELESIDRTQREEAERLGAKADGLAEFHCDLVEKKKELEVLRRTLVDRHWAFQKFFAVKLRLSRDENKELRRKAQLAEERLAKSGVHIVQVIEALNAQAEAKCAKMLEKKRRELDDKVDVFAKAHRELMDEKEASKIFRARLKKWYKEKLANELAKRQVPAAAALPWPLADSLLNVQSAEIPLPIAQPPQPPPLPAAPIGQMLPSKETRGEPASPNRGEPVQEPTSEPVKSDNDKVPAWMIGAIISGVAVIVGLIAAAVAI